jgi:hypothetical protein
VERRLVVLDGEQVVGPGVEGRLGDGGLDRVTRSG